MLTIVTAAIVSSFGASVNANDDGPEAIGQQQVGDFGQVDTINSAYASAFDWANDDGGVFNIPPKEFNPDNFGWGSFGFGTNSGIRYNKVDLHRGSNDDEENTMYIESDDNVYLYDSQGNVLARAWDSAIGYDHVLNKRDGGLIASAMTTIKIDGSNKTMAYAWSVNSNLGRRTSGWIKLSDLSPKSRITTIMEDTKDARDSILVANGAHGSALYEEHKIVEAYLPSGLYNYYVTAGRDDDNGAGRARYYYTDVDDQYISALLNIPETGSQRFGVAHNALAVNEKFYVASYSDSHDVTLYPPSNSSGSSTNVKLSLVWGYSVTNAGEKIYSWINDAALSSTGNTVGNGNDNGNDNDNDYAFCANENGSCSLPGPSTVRYGANGQYFDAFFNGGTVACNNQVFGDPIRGTKKTCEYKLSNGQSSSPSSEFTHCANERGVCVLPRQAVVRYGANGLFVEGTFSAGSLSCTNAVFGDPIPGTKKTCSYR